MDNNLLRAFREIARYLPKKTKVEVKYFKKEEEKIIIGEMGNDGTVYVGGIIVPLQELSSWMKSVHNVELIGIKEVSDEF